MITFTRHSAWLVALGMSTLVAQAQNFTNSSNLLPDAYNSGGCVGFADMDGDGYDDLIVLDESNTLHTLYQTPEGGFVDYNLGQVSNESQWGMCVADFDNDGQNEVVFSLFEHEGVTTSGRNTCTTIVASLACQE